jgi:hypothetical protein
VSELAKPSTTEYVWVSRFCASDRGLIHQRGWR